MKRSINGLQATIVDGRVANMFFNAVVERAGGARAAAPVTVWGPFQGLDALAESALPTQARTETAAMQLADDMGVFARLEAQVAQAPAPSETAAAPAPVMSIPALTDDEQKAALANEVDATIAGIITHFTRFQVGYEAREQAAAAYKAAGYAGDVSVWISGFAHNANLEYKTAADLILAQAEALRGAVIKLDGEQRMRKYAVANAATLEEARAIFSDIIANARAIEASLP